MIELIKSTYSYVTNFAIHQLLFWLLILVSGFCLLLHYPVEFDRVSYESKDYIDTTKSTHYILHTELTESGAKVQLETKSYYVEVKKDGKQSY